MQRPSRWAMAVHAGRIGIFSVQVMCLVHLVNQYMFEVRVCKGASMLPTLSPQGDLVLHMRSPFLRLLALTPLASSDLKERFSTKLLPRKMDSSAGTGLRMGDIVVALSPTDPSRTVCKRILGMPGDTVLVDPRQGHTDDDDLAFAASAIPELLQAPLARIHSAKMVTIPPGHVWLAGDNLANSTDSRQYGPVPIALVKGRVLAQIYPRPKWLPNTLHIL